MAENEGKNQEQNPDAQKPGEQGESQPALVPSFRLKEEMDRRRAAEDKVTKYEADKKIEEQKRLEETNQFKTLYESSKSEIDSLKSKVANHEKFASELYENELKTLNEDQKKLIEAVLPQGLDIVEKTGKVKLLKEQLFKTTPQGAPQPNATEMARLGGKEGSPAHTVEEYERMMRDPSITAQEKNKIYQEYRKAYP